MANTYKHRLVAIGDSLTHGVKSGAIFEPNLSYPSILAWEMGLDENEFRYVPFSGKGGLPINIEYLLRRMDRRFGVDVNWYELPLSALYLRERMDDIEDYWERGPGAGPLNYTGPVHNLAVLSFKLQYAFQLSCSMCRDFTADPSDNLVSQIPEKAMFRAVTRVLNPSQSTASEDLNATQIRRAKQLAEDGGIENLIIALGSNNVLGTVLDLEVRKSRVEDLDPENIGRRYNASNYFYPDHFRILLEQLMLEVEKLNDGDGTVGQVFWGNVPSVTIPPVSHGVGGRLDSDYGLGESPYGSDDSSEWYRRYFKFYTRPWIPHANFRKGEDPCLLGEEIVRIDRTIAAYNRDIQSGIDAHNQKRATSNLPPDWFLVDLNALLDSLAFRRYQEDPTVPPPPGWEAYPMPAALKDLNLNTRFLKAEEGIRTDGGIFSLDGFHPTATASAIVAQKFVDVMRQNGVRFFTRDGSTVRRDPIEVDFNRILRLDSLVNSLPNTLDDLWQNLVDGDQVLDLFKRAIRSLG